jgi:hypothetical protein
LLALVCILSGCGGVPAETAPTTTVPATEPAPQPAGTLYVAFGAVLEMVYDSDGNALSITGVNEDGKNLAAAHQDQLNKGCVYALRAILRYAITEELLKDAKTVTVRIGADDPLPCEDFLFTIGQDCQYLIDEEGYLKDIAYELPSVELQNYMGNDCSTALIQALWSVSNSVDFGHCHRQYPWDETGGCLFVGDWEPDPSLSVADSRLHIKYNGEEKIYQAYAQLKKGDFYVYNIPDVGGHTRMAAENAVVAYNQDGTINPNYSYVTSHEQGWTTTDEAAKTTTTCRANLNYTFANLMFDGAVPVTCQELVTGEMEPATAELIGGAEGKLGMVTGTVKTNYNLDYVDLTICDEQGNQVFTHRMWPTVGRTGDSSDAMRRFYQDTFDMGRFAAPLAKAYFAPGQTYSYKILAVNTPGDVFTVKEGSFTQGSAK